MEHGSIILMENRTTFGAKAQYLCLANYTLIGTDMRTCQQDEKWSGEEPKCLRKSLSYEIFLLI